MNSAAHRAKAAGAARGSPYLPGILPTACHLLLLLPVLEQTARRMRAGRVDGCRILLDVLDDPFLIHHKRCAVGETVFLVQDAVFQGDFPLLSEGLVGWGTVDADAEDLRVGLLELGDISLIRL